MIIEHGVAPEALGGTCCPTSRKKGSGVFFMCGLDRWYIRRGRRESPQSAPAAFEKVREFLPTAADSARPDRLTNLLNRYVSLIIMKKAIVLILLLLVTGCWKSDLEIQRISAEELNNLKCEWQEPKLSQWFYIGSENGYHMFMHRDLPGDKYYEIKVTEYNIESPIIISSDQSKWVLMPWGPSYEECKQ